MSPAVLLVLKNEQKNTLKSLEDMDKFMDTREYEMLPDEERDLFHDHYEALITVRDAAEARLDYYV